MINNEVDKMLYYENQRAKEFKPFTQNEAIEAFGISKKEANNAKIRFLKQKLDFYYKKYDKFLDFKENNYKNKWLIDWNLEEKLPKKIEKLEKQIYFLKNYKKFNNYKSFNLEAIKQIPIQEILEQRGIEIINNFFKIRDEKTASTYIYEKSNTWHDFGSGEGGDNIALIMKLDNCNFIEACKKLC